MTCRRAILTVLTALALAPAHGTDGFPVAGRLTADDGVTVLAAGNYRLVAGLTTNLSAQAFVQAEVAVRTDAEGFYAATLPLDVTRQVPATETLYLLQSFRRPDGVTVATLPAQRIGYAPYALHASAADRLSADWLGVTELAVGTGLECAAITVTNIVEATGTLIVTGAVVTGGDAVVKIDRLVVGGLGTSLLSAEAWRDTRLSSDSSARSFGAQATYDGFFALEVDATAGTPRTTVERTTGDGRSEALAVQGAAAGDGVRRLSVPVRAGENLTVSVENGAARLRWRFVNFGVRTGPTPGEGEE